MKNKSKPEYPQNTEETEGSTDFKRKQTPRNRLVEVKNEVGKVHKKILGGDQIQF